MLGPCPGVCHLAACLHELPTPVLSGLCCRDRAMCRSLPWDSWCPVGMLVLPSPGGCCAMNCDPAFALDRMFVLLRVHPCSQGCSWDTEGFGDRGALGTSSGA